MSDTAKRAWKKAFFVVGILAIGGLGYFSWHLNNEVQALKQQQQDNPFAMTQPLSQPLFDPWSKQQNPQSMFDEMRKQMDRMMNSFSAQSPFSGQSTSMFSAKQPDIQLKDEKNEYEVDINIPKGAEVSLNTQFADQNLTIKGSVKNSVKNEHQQFSSINQFDRTFYLADTVKQGDMKTTQSDDKIIITLPKA